ncbi:unnamed protein product [Linum trigynum]|uniref:Uncharacterized protein n=1 Tax=Linum trigynum TaxID=586398 RepID=A0AAV2DFG7_9ROSI
MLYACIVKFSPKIRYSVRVLTSKQQKLNAVAGTLTYHRSFLTASASTSPSPSPYALLTFLPRSPSSPASLLPLSALEMDRSSASSSRPSLPRFAAVEAAAVLDPTPPARERCRLGAAEEKEGGGSD